MEEVEDGMPLRRHLYTAAVLIGALTTSSLGRADPTKQQCVEANERAQALREQERLEAARNELAVCLATSCPGPVRQDCADRITEVDRAIATLVFDVTDTSGRDLTRVALLVDGKPLASPLDGAAVAIDPGTHELTFVARSGSRLTEMLVVREGEKGRRVVVQLEAATGLDPGRTRRIVGFGLLGAGAAGLIVGGVLGFVAKSTYDRAVSDDCGGNPARCTHAGVSQIGTAHAQATGSTAAFIIGGALLAGGVTLWITGRASVRVSKTASGTTMTLVGTF